jgi:hypothetical protein
MTTTEARAPCAFGRAILAGQAGCTLARRRALGEQEGILCASPVAHVNCATLLALLRERSTFALKLPPSTAPLPHAHTLRLQCGGIRAVAAALGEASAADVHAVIAGARERWGELAAIPFEPVVRAIAAWQPRRRSAGP